MTFDPKEGLSKINHRASKTTRRANDRRKNTLDLPIRRAKLRERPAYIRAKAQKEAEKATAEKRAHTDLRRKQGESRTLAKLVTDYVRKKGGEISGDNLPEIYRKVARVLLRNDSVEAAKRIERAVDYACFLGWLEKHEAEDNEARCSIPLLAAT